MKDLAVASRRFICTRRRENTTLHTFQKPEKYKKRKILKLKEKHFFCWVTVKVNKEQLSRSEPFENVTLFLSFFTSISFEKI